jgi:outer membrane murein-binding lipoprotein Lpp
VNLKYRSLSTRILTVFAAITALLLLAGCGDEKTDATPGTGMIKLSSSIDLVAKSSGFNKKEVTAKPGTIKITVSVPADAKGKHGVGIDGGQYKNIKGAPVAPGRSTSLTVAVKKGEYTIFDSYKNNREKGFTTKLTVK